jgi:hypothetical protein
MNVLSPVFNLVECLLDKFEPELSLFCLSEVLSRPIYHQLRTVSAQCHA